MQPNRVLDLDALRAFVAVAEHGSFTRAAARIHLTQSGISMRIRRLEEAEGVRLFRRQPGRLLLTAQGSALLPHARMLLAMNDAARAALHDGAAEVVRLGAMEDYATRVLPPLLADFAVAEPGVVVELESGLTARMLPELGRRHDLLLAMHGPGEASGGGVALHARQTVWAAAPGFATSAGAPVPLALYAEGCLFRRWAIEALATEGRPWRLAYASASQAAVEAAAAGGLGCAPVRASTCPPGLVPLPGLPALPEAEIRLHEAPGASRASRRLAGFLAARLHG
jgi:DNA-binding transcriptional LysR family regulator